MSRAAKEAKDELREEIERLREQQERMRYQPTGGGRQVVRKMRLDELDRRMK
jgi:hypothetical protein